MTIMKLKVARKTLHQVNMAGVKLMSPKMTEIVRLLAGIDCKNCIEYRKSINPKQEIDPWDHCFVFVQLDPKGWCERFRMK